MNLAIIMADWDTSLVLTVFLAPLCVVLIGVIFTQMWSNNAIKHDKNTAVNELREYKKEMGINERTFVDALAQKNADIQRQKKEIEHLHSELAQCKTGLDLYRQDAITHDKTVSDLKAEIARLKTKIP